MLFRSDSLSSKDGGKSSDQNGESQAGNPSGQDHSGQERSDRNPSDKHGTESRPQTAQQQAEQKAQAEQAQQALKEQMDQALAGQPQKPSNDATHQLGAVTDDGQSTLPPDLQHALQRVPDDPGALLRRKFQLEYQQRHGGARYEDGRP